MIGLICLIIGIIGFVKGRVSVTKHKELRGTWMYVVCALFCLPLPLSLLVGVIMGVIAVNSNTPLDDTAVSIAGLITSFLPLLIGLVLAFIKATPKIEAPSARGFEVQMPNQPPSPQ